MATKHAGRPPRRNRRTQARHSAGLQSRALALELLTQVLLKHRALDDALAATYADERFQAIDARDRGFARLLTATVLRRHGQLRAAIDAHLQKPLPPAAARADLILLSAAAQLLFLDTPAHAVIDTAVSLSRTQRASARFDRLINAVLRRISERASDIVAKQDAVALNIPDWMLARWSTAYGDEQAHAIAAASLNEAALDLTVRSDPAAWAEKLDAVVLPTGSLRRRNDGRVDRLPGFEQGAWWVQDAAAALPVRLLGPILDKRIADLCAAPGGKTAQLAAAGARVTALDHSEKRLQRVTDNLTRLGLEAEAIVGDAATWTADTPFDAVLADVPCTATGTIRRHPDILHLKRPGDLAKLAATQSAILRNAAKLVAPGGLLIYCTCSLEPEECEARIEDFLGSTQGFDRLPVSADEVGGLPELLTESGDLRTLPVHLRDPDPALSGIDGFYACRLRKRV